MIHAVQLPCPTSTPSPQPDESLPPSSSTHPATPGSDPRPDPSTTLPLDELVTTETTEFNDEESSDVPPATNASDCSENIICLAVAGIVGVLLMIIAVTVISLIAIACCKARRKTVRKSTQRKPVSANTDTLVLELEETTTRANAVSVYYDYPTAGDQDNAHTRPNIAYRVTQQEEGYTAGSSGDHPNAAAQNGTQTRPNIAYRAGRQGAGNIGSNDYQAVVDQLIHGGDRSTGDVDIRAERNVAYAASVTMKKNVAYK